MMICLQRFRWYFFAKKPERYTTRVKNQIQQRAQNLETFKPI
jgi:hypothetical protein